MPAIFAFVATVAALGVALSAAVAWTGGAHGPLAALGFGTMLLPALAAFVLRTTTNEGTRIDWARLPAGYIPVALFLIPAVMHAAMLPGMHLPFILSGILAADGVSAARMAIIVPLGVAGGGLVIGWLWLRTQSIWIVALAHGAMNDWGQFAFKYMDAGSGVDLAPVLLAGSAAALVTGAALMWSLRPSVPRIAAVALCVALVQAPSPSALDDPQWRGANCDGSASGFVEPRVWSAALTRNWRVEVGHGYGTRLIAGATVHAFTRRDGNEVQAALDADDGTVRWRSAYAASDAANGSTLWLGPPRQAIVKARGLLFLLGDGGDLIVARGSRAAFEPLKTYALSASAMWAQPAISGNRIFVRDASSLTRWTVR